MSIESVRKVLADAAGTGQLSVPVAQIEPLESKDQNKYPRIVITGTLESINAFDGWSGNDTITVTVNYWDRTYNGAHAIAAAARALLNTAGYPINTEADDFNDEAGLNGATCVTHEITYIS